MTVREQLDSFYRGVIPEIVRVAAKDDKIKRALTGYSCPFIPYVGEAYDTSTVRLLVVGKAPYGWDGGGCANLGDFVGHCDASGDVPADFWRWSDDFIVNKVQRYYAGESAEDTYHSLFWQRTYLLASAVLEGSSELNDTKLPERAVRCFGSIAWTNVFKIGGVCGNPDSRMEEFLCAEPRCGLLMKELQILQPELVLFSTHSSYDDHLKRMLPEVELSEPEYDISDVRLPGMKLRGFRTLHFQNRRFDPKHLLHRIRARGAMHKEC